MQCETCEGIGYTGELCFTCNGSGEGMYDGSRCYACKGKGYVICACEECDGTGIINEEEEV